MSTRHRYIVAYDIADDRRLRRMYRTMRGFGDPVQLSVFRCDLSPREYVLFEIEVMNVVNLKQDRVVVADLGPVEGRADDAVRHYGIADPPSIRRAVIV